MKKAIKTAVLYRMVTADHTCPYGLKSKHLLINRGYTVEDNLLTTREETDVFKEKYQVQTTPQTFIDGKRIGGYTELQTYFGKKVLQPGNTTYKPVVAIFLVAFLLALAVSVQGSWELGFAILIPNFISIAMVLLALMKLQDVESFSTMFLNYDVLARRWVPYGYIYPYAELMAGILMLAGAFMYISIPIALFIGTVGSWSVFKAVYIEKRKLKCACTGGNTNVPLGFVSLLENLMMIGMALWMIFTMI